MKKLIYICVFFTMVACSTTNNATDFAELKVGTTKGQILSKLGNPNRTYRNNSIDYWVYNLKNDRGVIYKKLLLFRNGNLIEVRHKGPEGEPLDSDFEEI